PENGLLPPRAPGPSALRINRSPRKVVLSERGLATALVKAATAAAGGFLAGVALMGLAHRRRRAVPAARRARRPQPPSRRRVRRSQRGAELVQVVGSRSLLVDVHLLGER